MPMWSICCFLVGLFHLAECLLRVSSGFIHVVKCERISFLWILNDNPFCRFISSELDGFLLMYLDGNWVLAGSSLSSVGSPARHLTGRGSEIQIPKARDLEFQALETRSLEFKELRFDAYCSRFQLPTDWHLIASEKKITTPRSSQSSCSQTQQRCLYVCACNNSYWKEKTRGWKRSRRGTWKVLEGRKGR